MVSEYELAQINVARMKGLNINDPIMKEFVDNLNVVNSLAEQSAGFVWRLIDENENATSLNPYNDEQVIVNISVWASIEDLEHFVYKTFHTDFIKRRKEWFYKYGQAHTAMWWIDKGDYPTIIEATKKLTELESNGPNSAVFNFKKKYPKP
jgi:hypothetical protein